MDHEKKSLHSPLGVLMSVIVASFLCEIVSIVISDEFPHSAFQEFVLEPTLLVVFLFPFLTFFIYRPLQRRIMERERAEDALRESERRLRYLSAQILSAQEQERRRISRELHDEFGQSLTLMKLQLRHVEESLRDDQKKLKEECGELLDYIGITIENARRVSRDLSPLVLDDLGLTAALKWLVNSFVSTYNVTTDADIDSIDDLFDEGGRITIYRIVQEGLTNVGRHAGAHRVTLTVRRRAGGIDLLLGDDGRGFDVDVRRRLEYQGGFGLAMMGERVRMVGGTMDITSSQNAGTRISIDIPASPGKKG